MKALLRWLGLVVIAVVALQLFFVARIAAMAVVDPQSTAFQRSEIWTQLASKGQVRWRQQWMPYDPDFRPPQARRDRLGRRQFRQPRRRGLERHRKGLGTQRPGRGANRQGPGPRPDKPVRAPKIRGGSTITQQLAKNLLLSGERTLLRKGQEFVLALLLEQLLSQAAHPGDLPQQRGMGRRGVWRRGRSPALLQEAGRTPVTARGRTPGRHAARAQALRLCWTHWSKPCLTGDPSVPTP
jgi:hypothetical protein